MKKENCVYIFKRGNHTVTLNGKEVTKQIIGLYKYNGYSVTKKPRKI